MLRFLPLLQLFGEFEPFGFEIIAFSIDGGELFIELVEPLVVARVMGGHLCLKFGLPLFQFGKLALDGIHALGCLALAGAVREADRGRDAAALTAAALPLPDFAELLPVPAKPGVSAGNPLPFLIASTISR